MSQKVNLPSVPLIIYDLKMARIPFVKVNLICSKSVQTNKDSCVTQKTDFLAEKLLFES